MLTIFKPTTGKIIVAIILFLFLFASFGVAMCIDPSPTGWQSRPDGDYWGCHYAWHRIFHWIPDLPISFNYGVFSAVLFLIVSYIFSCLVLAVINLFKRKTEVPQRGAQK